MPLKTQQDPLPDLNLTPMIDVLFLLIIFFMVGTKFAEMEASVKLEVPRVNQVGEVRPLPAKRVINIYEDGSVQMDHREMTLVELTNELTAETREFPELGVIVRGDADGRFQHVAAVLTACRNAGVRDLGIAVQRERTPK